MSEHQEIQNVSDTALWVAVYRAKESARPDALFHDPLAMVLAGDRGKKLAAHLSDEKIMSWIMVVRTVAIDRLIQETLGKGIDTVLNLGAGLDTRPYRMKLPENLRWIEVDFPAIIDLKNEKLRDHKPTCRLERIALDLSDRDRRRALFQRIASESKKVLVITEGVIIYLTNDEAASLSDDIQEQPQFRYWLFDFSPAAQRTSRRRKARMKNAPFKFHAPNWFDFFGPLGWDVEDRIFTMDEAKRIKRPFPLFSPWRLLFLFASKARREKAKAFAGYALMRNRRGLS